jgi:hypothetical protein
MPRPSRHYFPDEEPEDDHPWLSEYFQDLCSFCGHPSHGKEICPNKPLGNLFTK